MKKILLFSLMLFVGCGSLRGPAGPTGPQGEQGLSPKVINTYTGYLAVSMYSDSLARWEIVLLDTLQIGQSYSAQCFVTQDFNNYMWQEPLWYHIHNDGYLFIAVSDPSKSYNGWEYKINIIKQ